MFYVFRTRYRIVKDNYSGYEAQFRWWWWPFYCQVNCINTSCTVQEAEDIIRSHRYSTKVVKQIV
jgi:hypothetical protein